MWTEPERILDFLTGRRAEMVELLERLTLAESPSNDRDAQRPVFDLLALQLRAAGFEVRPVRGVTVGDHLYARPPGRRRGAPWQLVVGHTDTVWPVGTVEAMPARHVDDVYRGPGTYDMKAGLVQLVFALRAFDALELEPSVVPVVFLNSDEEIVSRESSRYIRALARGAARAFVLEGAAGADGRLKTARKGIAGYRVIVRGRAAHAGTGFDEGTSAILELTHQVQRLFALNDPARGITVNVGTIDGGLRPNVVAPEAVARIDVRAPTRAAAEEVDAQIRSLAPVLPGSTVAIEGGLGRPPMEPLPRNVALFEAARRLGRELGLSLADAGLVGGGSDANTTSLYAATLDGLGPVGRGAHAADEQIAVPSLAERAALLALLLLEPARRPRPRTARRRRGPRLLLVGAEGRSNLLLESAWRRRGWPVSIVAPLAAREAVRCGDVLLGRIDVRPTLDGIDPGLLELLLLERGGFEVLNRSFALLAAHDKLLTVRLLDGSGLPHPRTVHVRPGETPSLDPPLVVKPRFGSWGRDVWRGESVQELERCLAEAQGRRWFRRHGALLQELVPPVGHDLRIIVAGGRVVGAVERRAAAGEWRTNVALGASRASVSPSLQAQELALAAVAAVGADLAGVDLLPCRGGHTILEVNGAAEFDLSYTLAGRDIYSDVADALGLRGRLHEPTPAADALRRAATA